MGFMYYKASTPNRTRYSEAGRRRNTEATKAYGRWMVAVGSSTLVPMNVPLFLG